MNEKVIFTDEQLDWWKERLNGSKRVSKYIDEFVETFGGVKHSPTTYLRVLRDADVITEVKQPQQRYTDEQKDFIGNNIINYIEDGYFDFVKFSKDFKDRFGLEIPRGSLKCILNRSGKPMSSYGVTSASFVGSYERGYKKVYNKLPVGAEVIKGNRVYVKVDNQITKSHKNGERMRKNFRLKSHIMYEQYHGCKIADDEVIIHLDNDLRNFSKDNLVKMNEKLFIRFMNNNFHKLDPSLKLAAIQQCELMEAIKKRNNE